MSQQNGWKNTQEKHSTIYVLQENQKKKPKEVWWGQEIHGEEARKKDETKCVTNISL
jgi:hypothetical protein